MIFNDSPLLYDQYVPTKSHSYMSYIPILNTVVNHFSFCWYLTIIRFPFITGKHPWFNPQCWPVQRGLLRCCSDFELFPATGRSTRWGWNCMPFNRLVETTMFTMAHYGENWGVYSGLRLITMVFYGLSWSTMVCNGLPWFPMVYYGLLWVATVYRGLQWLTPAYYGFPSVTMVDHVFLRFTMLCCGIL